MRSHPDAGSVISHASYMMVWAEIAGLLGLKDSSLWFGNDSQAVGMRAELADPIKKPLQVILMGGLLLIYKMCSPLSH